VREKETESACVLCARLRACVRGLCIYFCHVLKQFTLAVIDYAWRCVEREREGVEVLYSVIFAYRHFNGTLHSPRISHFALCISNFTHPAILMPEAFRHPKHNVKSFSESSFSFAAPYVWKSLPASLRNLPTLFEFKTQLKTILCRQAFS